MSYTLLTTRCQRNCVYAGGHGFLGAPRVVIGGIGFQTVLSATLELQWQPLDAGAGGKFRTGGQSGRLNPPVPNWRPPALSTWPSSSSFDSRCRSPLTVVLSLPGALPPTQN